MIDPTEHPALAAARLLRDDLRRELRFETLEPDRLAAVRDAASVLVSEIEEYLAETAR